VVLGLRRCGRYWRCMRCLPGILFCLQISCSGAQRPLAPALQPPPLESCKPGEARPKDPGRQNTSHEVGIRPETVSTHIRNRVPALRACYNAALSSNADFRSARLVATWRIEGDGTVGHLCAEKANFALASPFARCLRKEIAGWRFPPASAGAVDISFPFEFAAPQ
jgi:hypothetical protein